MDWPYSWRFMNYWYCIFAYSNCLFRRPIRQQYCSAAESKTDSDTIGFEFQCLPLCHGLGQPSSVAGCGANFEAGYSGGGTIDSDYQRPPTGGALSIAYIPKSCGKRLLVSLETCCQYTFVPDFQDCLRHRSGVLIGSCHSEFLKCLCGRFSTCLVSWEELNDDHRLQKTVVDSGTGGPSCLNVGCTPGSAERYSCYALSSVRAFFDATLMFWPFSTSSTSSLTTLSGTSATWVRWMDGCHHSMFPLACSNSYHSSRPGLYFRSHCFLGRLEIQPLRFVFHSTVSWFHICLTCSGYHISHSDYNSSALHFYYCTNLYSTFDLAYQAFASAWLDFSGFWLLEYSIC